MFNILTILTNWLFNTYVYQLSVQIYFNIVDLILASDVNGRNKKQQQQSLWAPIVVLNINGLFIHVAITNTTSILSYYIKLTNKCVAQKSRFQSWAKSTKGPTGLIGHLSIKQGSLAPRALESRKNPFLHKLSSNIQQ